jgi:hypothetical protein
VLLYLPSSEVGGGEVGKLLAKEMEADFHEFWH